MANRKVGRPQTITDPVHLHTKVERTDADQARKNHGSIANAIRYASKHKPVKAIENKIN